MTFPSEWIISYAYYKQNSTNQHCFMANLSSLWLSETNGQSTLNKSSYKFVIIYPSIFVLFLLSIRTPTSVVKLIPPVVLGCLSILSVFEDPYVYQRMLVLDLGKTLSKICFYKFIGIIKIYLQTFQVARS